MDLTHTFLYLLTRLLLLIVVCGHQDENPFCDSVLSRPLVRSANDFQPFVGCRLLHYESQDVVAGLDSIHLWNNRSSGKMLDFFFIGDSRIRQKFDRFIKMIPEYDLVTDSWVVDTYQLVRYDVDRNSSILNSRVGFRWRPTISQRLMDEFEQWADGPNDQTPFFILIGVAAHHTKSHYGDPVHSFERNLTLLAPSLRKLCRKGTSRVIWWNQYPVIEKFGKYTTIHSEKIHAYNQIARRILKGTGVYFWDSSHRLAEEYIRGCKLLTRSFHWYNCEDFIHTGSVAIDQDLQIIFNHLFNRVLFQARLKEHRICC